ncbi:MAG: DUF494 domain-containing protein [Nitrosomonas sp.]|nr:DUF494 domain-containing protein [Nitrosomonas sp.]MDP1951965.1 DUF494 domain-containing protein [Nitrosomonas sp.]
MFDILVYLFENYFDSGSYPDSATLARKLTLAGFAYDEITQALDWLSELEQRDIGDYPATLAQNDSFRCYAPFEMEKIDAEGQGFIMFLEHAGMLNPLQRELLIDQVLAMNEQIPSMEKMKLIVLTELWMKNQLPSHSILGKLLIENDPYYRH